MGMGPLGSARQFIDQMNQQPYQQDFSSSAYAAIPGVRGPQPGAMPNNAPPTSQWNSLNGRQIGDIYLPPDVSTTDVGNGWYDVNHGGQRVGTLRPGGDNGRFINNTNWQMPQPALVGGPPSARPGGGGMPMRSQPMSPAGPYGAQAMQLAGLLGQPQPPAGGLLGGPKRGFRPGGK
jgi:hypothetical protein